MKKIAVLSMLTGFALMLSYVESLIPLTPGIPGIKLGLANLAVVLCLYLYDWKDALMVNVARVLLASFLFGNLYVVLYSLAGALASFAAMAAAKRAACFSMIGVSVCGGVFHNAAQLLVATAVVRTIQVVWYLPWLLIAGCVTGMLIGLTAMEVLKYVRISDWKGG
ncbi:MAG: Gx transporter family protein [Eubacteriales bacterium]|nr:Gx transporter family protein [Eubacteriales bacterium]